jgi:DNA-binding MarR family transcriptional regulator
MAARAVNQVRSFNRTVTQRVGALSDRFLALDRPLGEARMLWEIGTEGCEVRALRTRLGLDSGHASRLLRSLERAGLVRVEPSRSDRRIRVAELTAAGRDERALLDERSDELAASMLAPLDPDQRERLIDAMRTVERLLTFGAIEIRQVDPAHPDARQCFRAYFDELGRRLLAELEELGRARGARTARLDTNSALIEALALYRSAGYREVPRFNDDSFADRWFEKRLGPC